MSAMLLNLDVSSGFKRGLNTNLVFLAEILVSTICNKSQIVSSLVSQVKFELSKKRTFQTERAKKNI